MIEIPICRITLRIFSKHLFNIKDMEQLNKVQQEAVLYCDGPSLIVAGAGSGKTRVLTYKIAYLIQSGTPPERIMALTFTNKAAKEMKERIGAMVGFDVAEKIKMGTFHSIFAKILQREAFALEMTSNFTIYDETDSKNLIADIIKEYKLETDSYKPSKIKAKISKAKNELIEPDIYMSNTMIRENDEKDRMKYCGEIYKLYQDRLKVSNAMDFDDLLLNTFKLFRDNPSTRERYQEALDWVLVDEFQDTNIAQMKVLMQLCRRKQNLVVVGDDAQSIYSFRGANINNILMFSNVFQNARTFKLEQNYRSTQTIVAGANSLIHHNIAQIDKNVFSKGDKGDKIYYVPFYTDRNEGEYIAQSCNEVHRVEQCQWSDITVLYRSNALSRCIEEAMLQYKIPYRIHGGISFFQRADVKNMLGYLKLIANPNDDQAYKRIANWPKRGIGNKTIERISEIACKYHVPMLYVATEPDYFGLVTTDKTKAKLKEFGQIINSIEMFAAEHNALEVFDKVMDSFHLDEYIINLDEDSKTDMIVSELISSIESFVEVRKEENRLEEAGVVNYLQDVALLAEEVEEENKDSVNLMTIHASKGLEYNTIYIVGCEEGIFPSKKSSQSPQELEEERRLMYVAITRAEKHCFITNAKRRWLYGEEQKNEPSRFISDIDDEFIEEVDAYAVDDDPDEPTQGYFD